MIQTLDLRAYLEERKTLIDAALERCLPPASEPPARVHEAMRYSTLDGGKRIRPILTLAAHQAISNQQSAISNHPALPAACAIECIHAFSLIHDDLPCMDDDDFRRGRPTAHKVFGEAMALLAGDALFALAFQLISETRDVAGNIIAEVMRRVAGAAGTHGMVGGQVMDMLAQGRRVELAEVENIHRLKTGALLETSVVVGGLLGGGTPDEISALTDYGRNVGLAFQIADDILDIEGDFAKLGKPPGGDLRMEKATYPSAIGVEASSELARRAMNDAIAAISGLDDRAEPLRLIARFVVERDA